MRIRSSIIGFAFLISVCLYSVSGPATAAENTCLSCHDDFPKLAAATAGYVAPSKEKGTPHRYVPHDSKDIPDCTKCHKPHSMDPLPAKGSLDKSKVGIDYCYTACHHEKTLETCKNCHP